jgi:4-amino-4-deoxy-L-arabinose transferase-like glycosyltransferase
MMGLGILAKGILGILLPGLAVGLYFVVRRRWRDFFRPAVVMAFFAALAIGLSWYLAAYQVGGQKFLQWQLDMNLWSRFVPAEAGGAGYCAHPFWYFAPHTIAGFIPWSVYLPALALYAWPRPQRRLPEAAVFTLCWFTAIFVFFSLSHGKCLVYILPAFAPLAVLTGITIDAAAATLPESNADAPRDRGDAARGPVTIAFNLATIAVAAAGAALVLVAIAALVFGIPDALAQRLHPTDRRFLEIFTALAANRAPVLPGWIITTVAGSALAFYGVGRRRAQLAAGGVLVIAAAGSFLWFAAMNPALADRETLRDFAHEVAKAVPPGADVVHLGLSDCDLNFYSPAPLTPIYRLACDDGAPAYVVARKRDFTASPSANRSCYVPLLESAPVDNNGTRVLLRRSP